MRNLHRILIFTFQTDKLNILCTTGHGKTSRYHHRFFTEFIRTVDKSQKTNGLSFIFLRIILNIQIKDTIVCICNLDDILFQIIWKFICVALINGSVFPFIYNLCTTVYSLDRSAEFCFRRIRGTAVKYNHICMEHLLHHHGTHIIQIHLKSGCIHGSQRLYDLPSFRELHLKNLRCFPGTVILDKHLIRFDCFITIFQIFFCEFFF